MILRFGIALCNQCQTRTLSAHFELLLARLGLQKKPARRVTVFDPRKYQWDRGSRHIP